MAFSGEDRSTWHDDRAAHTRSVVRKKAAIERERIVLERYVHGWRVADIAREVDRDESTVYRILERALERRAANDEQTLRAAQAIYVDRLSDILAAHMPLATGSYRQKGEDGELAPAGPPDVRSAELCLKLADRLLALRAHQAGDTTNAPTVEIHLHGAQLDRAREEILSSLDRMAQHQNVIEGEMAGVGGLAELTAAVPVDDDRPGMPEYDPDIAA